MNHDKRIDISELKPGARVILQSGLRARVAENNGGSHITISIDGDESTGKWAVKASNVKWARMGAMLVEVKHTSGESK